MSELHTGFLKATSSYLLAVQNDKSKITEMFSAQGEKVEMEHPVEAKGRLFRIFLNRSLYYTSCTSGACCCTDLP